VSTLGKRFTNTFPIAQLTAEPISIAHEIRRRASQIAVIVATTNLRKAQLEFTAPCRHHIYSFCRN
jgi:hypothetical protein